MTREFWRRYFLRVLVLLPFIAIIGFIPPYPLSAKIFGLFVVLIAMLVVQLVEVLIYVQARQRQREKDLEESERVGDSWDDGSRKARRRRARLEGSSESD